MTNGTSQKANISPFVSGQSRMLDSVIAQLSDMDGLAATKRRDLKSALNSMARMIGRSPAEIPANINWLHVRVSGSASAICPPIFTAMR